ncbi:MAG: hypothetical protein ACMG55_17635, partial [Microcoleus sp.]
SLRQIHFLRIALHPGTLDRPESLPEKFKSDRLSLMSVIATIAKSTTQPRFEDRINIGKFRI